MTIEKISEVNSLTFVLKGRLDSSSAPELEAVLDKHLPGVQNLIFDMEELEYTSSAGLRLLLKAQKIMLKQGTMKLIHVNSSVMDVFDVTGFSDILTIE